MSEKYESLSGFWTGVYDYPDEIAQMDMPDDAVTFNVLIVDIAGHLSGEISEPNTFPDVAGEVVFATLSGERADQDVMFLKTYIDVPEAEHGPIKYEGIADKDLTRIEGTWTTPPPYSWSGPFIMNRSNRAQGETLRKEHEDLITVD